MLNLKKSLAGLCIAFAMVGCSTQAEAQGFASIVKAVQEKNESSDTAKFVNKKKYEDVITEEAETQEGMFKVHLLKNRYYFEIPDSLLGRDMLLSSRVAGTSNNKDIVAGQMPKKPLLIRFTKDDRKVYLHYIMSENIVAKNSTSINKSLKRNNLDPILTSFSIKADSKDGNGSVVDVTKFFSSDIVIINPFKEASILDMLFKRNVMTGTFQSDNSDVTKVKSFDMNVNIESRLTYKVQKRPFVANMVRSILLLPEKPMMPRIADERIGYFTDRKYVYDENKDKGEKIYYINRWRLEPKDEDIEKFKAGELVEPKKPIVYYVDDAFPEKWKKYIKIGIEDWQTAFEEIGFKNAIIAKDFPKDDSTFCPEDAKYSCFRYITTKVANAMGPSWTDPRSGEIIQGDVMFYHNVLKLVHNWRFVQTAAVDPRVRKSVFDEEVLGESIRYVAAHEIGHTVGLLHNFGASYSYPVDSLRSASFTQKYGTTPSIMDYARNNYVAQPGDKGVRLTPPVLGVYDIFAIKWGYTPIYGVTEPEQEYETLNRWILDKADDKMYHYGPQQFFFNSVDPQSQSEALGDDAIKASEYGIKNLKIIIDNLDEWATTENKNYDEMAELFQECFIQYNRYIGHVEMYLGGIYLYSPVKGEDKKAYTFVSKKKQKEALKFIIDQMYNLNTWLDNPKVYNQLSPKNSIVADYQGIIIRNLIHSGIFSRMVMFEKQDPLNAYTTLEYMDDIYDYIFAKTKKGRALNYYERNIQYNYIKALLSSGQYIEKKKSKRGLANIIGEAKEMPCMYCQLHNKEHVEHEHEHALVSADKESDVKVNLQPIIYEELVKAEKLLKRAMKTRNKATRIHYQNLYHQIKKVLE